MRTQRRRTRRSSRPITSADDDQLARDFAFLTALFEDITTLASDGQDPTLSHRRKAELLGGIETGLAAAMRLMPKMRRRLASPSSQSKS